ncbi:P-II family nitrogen regulator [Deinococcus marmoris]|uniref:P-II family nitrogen regulator n=1 Tax=Deinococcus marmoris TaxID=249408 RepID=UPI000495D571|nr:P-II family nitrogen regulator [Deinococcus marmoris]
MKMITAVIRPERVQQVKEALFQAGISGITLSRVSGHGGEQEIIEQYRGTRVMIEFRDKVEIRMAVSEPFEQAAIDAICKGARTGEVGDGKIFVQALERVVRIRTGEEGNSALTPVTEKKLAPV